MDHSISNDKTVTTGGTSGGHAYALKPGGLFGQYRVIRALGAGGMGEVYEVEHTKRARLQIFLQWVGLPAPPWPATEGL